MLKILILQSTNQMLVFFYIKHQKILIFKPLILKLGDSLVWYCMDVWIYRLVLKTIIFLWRIDHSNVIDYWLIDLSHYKDRGNNWKRYTTITIHQSHTKSIFNWFLGSFFILGVKLKFWILHLKNLIEIRVSVLTKRCNY